MLLINGIVMIYTLILWILFSIKGLIIATILDIILINILMIIIINDKYKI